MRPRLPVTLFLIAVAGAWRVAPAMASECDHEIVIPPLHVCTIGELTTFTLDGGQPFHETSCIVQDVRLVVVPESTVLLILWEEQDRAGRCLPHYAITYDGQSISRCEKTCYDLWLRYAQFDPAQGEPPIPPELLAPDADEGVYLVQFVTYPLEVFRERVRGLGGVIHSYQANHAYLVRMTRQARQRVQGLPYVRAVVPFHPAYKSAEFCPGEGPAPEDPTPYNILVFEPGSGQARIVADRVVAVGGSVEAVPAAGSLLRATLTGEQLRQVVRLPEVAFVGRYSLPVACVDIAREIGGADFVHDTLGFTGEGVTGEVMDVGLPAPHVEYPGSPEYPEGFRTHGDVLYPGCGHATPVTGIVFATGVGPPEDPGRAKGFLPGAGPENRIVADAVWVGNSDRKAHTRELVDETLDWKAVFQTNSWGHAGTSGEYTVATRDLDEILWDPNSELFLLHASGKGGQPFMQQAVAKNLLTVGGTAHHDTLTKDDDTFPPGFLPEGPTADWRIKPDLVHFADCVFTTAPLPDCEQTSDQYQEDFNGSSAATPITAGHAGLFFQMWKEEVFAPYGGGPDPFTARPHISTTKAMLINTAVPYDLGQLSRKQQGWGMADLRRMYDAREYYLIVDETELLDDNPDSPAPDMKEWTYVVSGWMAEFRATLVYTDYPGDPWAWGGPGNEDPWPGGPKDLKNDLDLRVTSPAGTDYWGNYGLGNHHLLPGGVPASNWSLSGGWPDDRNNVENVFIANPAPGDWIVRVSLRDLVEDGHAETPEWDVDFAVVVTTIPP